MTSDNIQNLKGLRNSKNRDNVIAVLSQKNIPISVEDIFYEVKKMNSKIAISTVYRIIEKLYKLEIVQKSATNDGKSLYELSQNGHKHYIICTKCKKIVALKVCPIPDIEKKISNDTGFHITGHKYELYGECKDCQLKDNS